MTKNRHLVVKTPYHEKIEPFADRSCPNIDE